MPDEAWYLLQRWLSDVRVLEKQIGHPQLTPAGAIYWYLPRELRGRREVAELRHAFMACCREALSPPALLDLPCWDGGCL
ncbi:hypothetical protein NDU88_004684 [Pleurodeles waltl]|uniref:Uncharacterized protein n=1 Tax=Pleurodeles waltl TaxID=8319 RepID=A0AAV7NT64_PLEWA|nr:hypothetical protein NDU88_004684 [Pleurodeles waltl]